MIVPGASRTTSWFVFRIGKGTPAVRNILLQLDTDSLPSSFDAITALDAGAEVLLPYGGVTPERAVGLVHGAIFTRGPEQLHRTAIFIGGSDVAAAEAVAQAVTKAFFGPMRVSVVLDPNGSNTTAAAAVLAVVRHVPAPGPVLVLGGTGPVGSRAARLLAREGYSVQVGSRSLQRAQRVVEAVLLKYPKARLQPLETAGADALRSALGQVRAVLAAGAAGVQLLSQEMWQSSPVELLIDLNAVPPAGIQGVQATDKAAQREGKVCYGAVGIGGTKMKIHRRAIARAFEQNDLVLDAEEIYELGRQLDS